ncbi:MFS transporter [Amycolatopsis jejuensis]|uniref:MFS transporter n=1 Tax=Amycolatopsis jejuensis TaxID=330084 RepID=UPI000525EC01|nr:aromatic acid/H+ symport family MFS transporter [Amycolatopsis jejuensis]
MTPPRRRAHLVVAICFLCIVFDGYDLVSYGTVVPVLLAGHDWVLTPGDVGWIGSMTFIGMLGGTLIAGTVSRLAGIRRTLLGAVTWFSSAMVLCALAPSAEVLGILRLVTGLGLGAIAPATMALTLEFAHPARRGLTNAMMYCGFAAGGLLASLIAVPVLPALGWRAMFWIGALPLVLILPVALRYLPESPHFLLRRGDPERARQLATRFGIQLTEQPADRVRDGWWGLRTVFPRGERLATILLWCAMLLGFLLIFGLNTWLAQIMRDAGYSLGSALVFLLVLNLGAIAGAMTGGALADRFGDRVVTAGMFAAAAAGIFLLSFRLPLPVLLLLVAVAGGGTIGTQIQVCTFVGRRAGPAAAPVALSWAMTAGRTGAILGPLYGGLVLTSGWGFAANFYAFAVPALLGAAVVGCVPNRRRATPAQQAVQPENEEVPR